MRILTKLIFLFCIAILSTTASLAANVHSAAVAKADDRDDFAELASRADHSFDQAPASDPASPYEAWQVDFARRSWEWHLLSTKVIFVIVTLVVLFGLFVSWLQFRTDIRVPPAGKSAPGEEGQTAYDVSASLQSVSIKSKTIGVVILVFSGVFFFLYLSIVYPMTVVHDPASAAHSTGDSAEQRP